MRQTRIVGPPRPERIGRIRQTLGPLFDVYSDLQSFIDVESWRPIEGHCPS